MSGSEYRKGPWAERFVNYVLRTTLDRIAHSVQIHFFRRQIILEFYRYLRLEKPDEDGRNFGKELVKQETETYVDENCGLHLIVLVVKRLQQLNDEQEYGPLQQFYIRHDKKTYRVDYWINGSTIRFDFGRATYPGEAD